MIQTTLTSTARYAAMSPLLAKAVNFIAMAKDLPVGRYEIQGADIYAMVVETTLKEPKECRLE
ncbi:MAG: YhcH/YjgK/YiaL family protein, partial [Mucinivorans sp.]